MVDPRQFGVVPKSSTSYALISMIHHLTSATDGNGSLARLVFFDYRKAFDLTTFWSTNYSPLIFHRGWLDGYPTF